MEKIKGMLTRDEIDRIIYEHLEREYPERRVYCEAELDDRYDSYGDYRYTVFEGYSYSVE